MGCVRAAKMAPRCMRDEIKPLPYSRRRYDREPLRRDLNWQAAIFARASGKG